MIAARRLTVALLLLTAVRPAAAEPAPDPPSARAVVDTTAAQVGGRLRLEVEIESAEGWRVEPPAAESLDLGSFRARRIDRSPTADGTRYRFAIVPLEPGEQTIPSLTFVAHGPEGKRAEITTDPIEVAIASNLAVPAESAPASPSAPPEPAGLKPTLDAPRTWWPLLVAAAGFALATIVGFWLFRKLRARRRPEAEATAPRQPLRPAWEIAFEELDQIAAADWVAHGQLRRQYDAVTETLRRYLENRYGVPALESTTTDLTEHLRASPLPTEVSSRILSLLREADLVKFAKASPDPSDARSTEGRARGLVRETMPRPAPEMAA